MALSKQSVSEETYSKLRGLKPNDLDDLDYLKRVSIAMNISKENIALAWASEDYVDYRKKHKEILKKQYEDKKEKSSCSNRIATALEEIKEGIPVFIRFPDDTDKFVTDLPTMKILEALEEIRDAIGCLADKLK